VINTCKYAFKPIDEVGNDLIGLKITDIEEKGRAIYLEDSEGRTYTIDTTGKDGVIVHADATDKERIELLEQVVDALMQILDVTEDKIFEIICDEA